MMHRQVGDLQIIDGVAQKGLLVRHLVLPDGDAGSYQVIDFLKNTISPETAINVMDQYRPSFEAACYAGLNHYPAREEIACVRAYALKQGLRILD